MSGICKATQTSGLYAWLSTREDTCLFFWPWLEKREDKNRNSVASWLVVNRENKRDESDQFGSAF